MLHNFNKDNLLTSPKYSIQIYYTKIVKLNSSKNVFDAVFSFIGFQFTLLTFNHEVPIKIFKMRIIFCDKILFFIKTITNL